MGLSLSGLPPSDDNGDDDEEKEEEEEEEEEEDNAEAGALSSSRRKRMNTVHNAVGIAGAMVLRFFCNGQSPLICKNYIL